MPITFQSVQNEPDFLPDTLIPDPSHPHVHHVDMPYRITSTWQDLGCTLGIWEENGAPVAWALFQPAWWNADYALAPAHRGGELELTVFRWCRDEMQRYADRTGESFYGSIEFFPDAPRVDRTRAHLQNVGFVPFSWSTLRFAIDIIELEPLSSLPSGFALRTLDRATEIPIYVDMHRAAFDSDKMTVDWRRRVIQHTLYRKELDLVITNADDVPVAFCLCWERDGLGQIEPLGVHPEYQGQGLGRALERAALQAMREIGVPTVYVDHVSLNEAAIAVSSKTGFRQINDAVRYYVDIVPAF